MKSLAIRAIIIQHDISLPHQLLDGIAIISKCLYSEQNIKYLFRCKAQVQTYFIIKRNEK